MVLALSEAAMTQGTREEKSLREGQGTIVCVVNVSPADEKYTCSKARQRCLNTLRRSSQQSENKLYPKKG
jgi:hypothetical protein